MSFLLVPSITTPLLKVPLLLGHAVCTYQGMTPPRPPPQTDEQKRFAIPDYMTRTTAVQLAVTAIAKWALCSVAVFEAGALLARAHPSHVSDRVLSALFPYGGNGAYNLVITPLGTAACVLGITGGLIRIWCHRTLGKLFTWQMAVQDDHKLVTSGPYSFVRHPSYTGWVLMVAGNFALLLSKGSYFVEAGLWTRLTDKIFAVSVMGYLSFVSFSLVSRVAKEDAVLSKEFGAQWDEWAKKTPYRLIPYIY